MGIIGASTGRYNKMGRKVLNSYEPIAGTGFTWLTVASAGYYTAKAKLDNSFDAVAIVDNVRRYKWCYEQSKGQIFTSDLTLKLAEQMRYKTPKIYLRDFIIFLLGHNPHKIEWRRATIDDYTIKPCDLHPRIKHF
jgi:hypothetical protein